MLRRIKTVSLNNFRSVITNTYTRNDAFCNRLLETYRIANRIDCCICLKTDKLCGFDGRAPFAEDSLDSRRMRVTVFPQTS